MRRVALAALLALLATGPVRADPGQLARTSTEGVDAVTRGPSVDERLAIIQKRVQSAASYPALAQLRRVEGTSLVAFEIGADGSARAVEIAASSGSPQLDRAASQAVHDAGRLPWVYGRLEVPVRFELARR